MSLNSLLKGAKIIEAVENYSVADDNKKSDLEISKRGEYRFYSDEEFWHTVMNAPDKYWNKKINLRDFVISSWVARVPGFYWTSEAKNIRIHEKEDIAIKSRNWMEFYPPGKSKKVVGGIGTFLLAPGNDGKVLASISASCNASLGIPILLDPDVMDKLHIREGDVVDIINAKWQRISHEWSGRFASTSGIPRGYIVIDKSTKIRIRRRDCPVMYHPFSIMEYQSSDALLYDFVYLTIDSKVPGARREIEKFFNYYSKKDGRYGRYLLNPNMVEPLFDTMYSSPSELQRPSEKAKLDLLYQRVRQIHFKEIPLEKLIEELPKYYSTSESILRLAKDSGIGPTFIADDNVASMSAQLINLSIGMEKTEELIDRMNVEYPEIFK